MIVRSDLVRASVARWKKKARVEPAALAQKLGEGEREQVTGPQRATRFSALLNQVQDPVVARMQLERIIEGNDLTGINYLTIGTVRARSVCRVHLRNSAGRTVGFGTGFLVGPGVLMTNHHVIAGAEDARYSLVEFQYEYDVDGTDRPVITFAILADPTPIANQPLDFSLVRVAPRSVDGKHAIEDFGWLPLSPTPGKAIIGEYLTVIQHPSGERKQVCVRENKVLKYDESGTTLWYKTDTAAGSSGSPVFNDTWQVVALHHSGVPETNDKGQWLTIDGKVWDQSMDETQVKWIANEGVRISSILQFLSANNRADMLAHAVLEPGTPPARKSSDGESTANGGSEIVGDELRLTIPVRVSVRLDTAGLGPTIGNSGNSGNGQSNGYGNGHSALGPTPVKGLLPPAAVRVIEKVVVNQDNYDERPGYDPTFLGKGRLAIPLPTVSKAALKKSVLTFGSGAKKSSVLDYWNYSVIMNKSRQLAFLSAINVDGGLRKGARDAEGDRWFVDTRIDEQYQLGPEFYGAQKTFEVVDRVKNPFDRGHLSARNDAQWGKTAKEAKRNGDDSYHWVNCSPQHYLFNQGSKLWAGLEVYVITGFAEDSDGKASVFNGPVFDAPLSSLGADGRPVLNLTGQPHKDPTFGDVAIPKMFFKIVACERDGQLAVAAFIISQEDILATVDRLKGLPPLTQEKLTAAEAKLFQVSVADVAKLTGLDFGPLLKADTIGQEIFAVHGPLELRRFEQVAL